MGYNVLGKKKGKGSILGVGFRGYGSSRLRVQGLRKLKVEGLRV